MFLLIVKFYFGFYLLSPSALRFRRPLKKGNDNRELSLLDDQKLEAAAYNIKVAS